MSKSNRIHWKVTHADCEFTFTKGGGPGGQNVNKRSTKARCFHKPSGASGMSADERSQLDNKKTAFMRMARTPEFKRWVEAECAKLAGVFTDLDKTVEDLLLPKNLRLEVKNEQGQWEERDWNAALDGDEATLTPIKKFDVDIQGIQNDANITAIENTDPRA